MFTYDRSKRKAVQKFEGINSKIYEISIEGFKKYTDDIEEFYCDAVAMREVSIKEAELSKIYISRVNYDRNIRAEIASKLHRELIKLKSERQMTRTEVDIKIDEWGEARGIAENGTPMAQAIKTVEEATELLAAINTDNKEELMDAIGDIYVTLRMQCLVNNICMDDCISKAYNEIKDRKGFLRKDGTFVKDEMKGQLEMSFDDSCEYCKEFEAIGYTRCNHCGKEFDNE
jgi:phosphoribosyl-ATP pyrophosphohydrolase